MAVNVNYQKFNACIENLMKLNDKVYENLNNYVTLGTSLEKKSAWNGIVSESYMNNISLLQSEIEEIRTQFVNIISTMQNSYNYYKNIDQKTSEKLNNILTKNYNKLGEL